MLNGRDRDLATRWASARDLVASLLQTGETTGAGSSSSQIRRGFEPLTVALLGTIALGFGLAAPRELRRT